MQRAASHLNGHRQWGRGGGTAWGVVRPRDRHPGADRGSAQAPPPDLPGEDCSSSASETRGTRVLWGPLLNPSPRPHCCLPSVGCSAVPLCWPPRVWRGPQSGLGAQHGPRDASACAMRQKTIASSHFSAAWSPASSRGKLWLTWGGTPALDTWPRTPGHSPEVPSPRAECAPGPQVDFNQVSIKLNGILISIILSPPASKPTGASPFSASPHDPCLTV